MAYYVTVSTDRQGNSLSNNLNLLLPQYIMKTAKWSGFGNEKVFVRLPQLPDKMLTDDEMFQYFDLTLEECDYVRNVMAKSSGKNK